MSCEECNDEQERNEEIAGMHTYVRVGNGNVLIMGCKNHLTELINKLRDKDSSKN